ncbi:hypothetical protein IMSAGC002_02220 [Lachnospiraceae bacterium]|nr:hypothetical protein IMSAGC002_02220 [Lachnospiraceae bacterium]
MMLWNYLIAPIYMGYPREAIAALLLPAFLPFNLIKGGLNTAITLLLYKPVVVALRRANLIPSEIMPGGGELGKHGFGEHDGRARLNLGVAATALLIIVTCVLLILFLNDVI